MEKERLTREAAEHHDSASAETQRLVEEAEERATAAQQRAREATEAATAHREQAAQEAEQLVSRSRREAEQIVSAAKKQADALRNSGHADSERELQVLKAEVNRLTRVAGTRSPPSSPPCATWWPGSATTTRADVGAGSGDEPARVRGRSHLRPDPASPPGTRRTPHHTCTRPAGEARPRGTFVRSPFRTGFLLTAGALLAYWLGDLILRAGSVIILIVVALFVAFGLTRW